MPVMLNNVMLLMLNDVILNTFQYQYPSNPAVMSNPTPRLSNQTLLHTYNACITPGTQANNVSIKLSSNLTLSPVFIKTASGGSRTQRIIVSNDIVSLFICLFSFQSLSFLKESTD